VIWWLVKHGRADLRKRDILVSGEVPKKCGTTVSGNIFYSNIIANITDLLKLAMAWLQLSLK
jgi:hypothetical protein